MQLLHGPAQLTPRQLQVIGLVRRGLSNSEIGQQLGISDDGVKAHLSRLYLRFGVSNRVALLAAVDEQARALAATSNLGELRAISGHEHERSRQFAEQGAAATMSARLAATRNALAAVDATLDLLRDLPPETTGPVLDALRKRVASAVAALDDANAALDSTSRRIAN